MKTIETINSGIETLSLKINEEGSYAFFGFYEDGTDCNLGWIGGLKTFTRMYGDPDKISLYDLLYCLQLALRAATASGNGSDAGHILNLTMDFFDKFKEVTNEDHQVGETTGLSGMFDNFIGCLLVAYGEELFVIETILMVQEEYHEDGWHLELRGREREERYCIHFSGEYTKVDEVLNGDRGDKAKLSWSRSTVSLTAL